MNQNIWDFIQHLTVGQVVTAIVAYFLAPVLLVVLIIVPIYGGMWIRERWRFRRLRKRHLGL